MRITRGGLYHRDARDTCELVGRLAPQAFPSVTLKPPLACSCDFAEAAFLCTGAGAPGASLVKGRWAAHRRLGGIVQQVVVYGKSPPAKTYCGNESPSLGNAEPAPFDKGALAGANLAACTQYLNRTRHCEPVNDFTGVAIRNIPGTQFLSPPCTGGRLIIAPTLRLGTCAYHPGRPVPQRCKRYL